jgi:hypothetical protein
VDSSSSRCIGTTVDGSSSSEGANRRAAEWSGGCGLAAYYTRSQRGSRSLVLPSVWLINTIIHTPRNPMPTPTLRLPPCSAVAPEQGGLIGALIGALIGHPGSG